jgi:hypothetical protein
LKIFEMRDPFPRAWFVSGLEVFSEEDQAITRLGSDDFDLQHSAVVTNPLAEELLGDSDSVVVITEATPTYLKADVDASGNHLLVISQIFYPGWQAKIDGRPVELKRVNTVLQGVVVSAGRQTVEVSYEPVSFWWGSIISLIGISIVVVLLVLAQIKKLRSN